MLKLIKSDKTPIIAQIVATDENGLIGIGDKLPWGRVKEDMEFFKYKTLNRVVIMGYNTILSLPFKLPYRYMVGVTNRPNEAEAKFHERVDNTIAHAGAYSGLRSLNSLVNQDDEKFYDYAVDGDIIFIAGGGKIYETSLLETDVVFRNVIVKDKSIYPEEGAKVYYPLERLKQNFTLISWEEEALAYGGYMHKEIWVKVR